MTTPIAVTPQDVANAAKVCLRTVFAEIRRGRLKAFKVGRTTRIKMADLDAWLGAKPIAPKVEPSDDKSAARHGLAHGHRKRRR
jgi:excisionase family DNA binding protein